MANNVVLLLSALEFDSYKSFSSNGAHKLELGKNITLIIGKNNSGKSSLIDVIESLFEVKQTTTGRGISKENIQVSFLLDLVHIKIGFHENMRNINIPSQYSSDYGYGSQFVDRTLKLKWINRKPVLVDGVGQGVPLNGTWDNRILSNWIQVAEQYARDMQNLAMLRISAERDIVPEVESDNEDVSENGEGATNLVRKYINKESYDEAIVEKVILKELNKIMQQDASFSAIRIQQIGERTEKGYKWEIYLEESGKRYAISKSGSGLKTIILILINLYLIPLTEKYRSLELCYAFEEIENNLHPALQKRVFDYLYEYAIEKNTKIFITSHSPVAINTFYGKDKSKLYHVSKINGESLLTNITNGSERNQILDDLGVKASDLFQTNGIIWVEGPSDRIYILQWLKTFVPNFSFKEGLHFQFMYYGGRLLSHYEANEFENRTDDFINVLTTNRNAVMIMDSDRRGPHSQINKTKKRVRHEFESAGLYCWITKGKEIENYLSAEAINKAFDSSLIQVGAYDLFPEYIKKVCKNFENNKVDVARKVIPYIAYDNSYEILDLKEGVLKVYSEIKRWNPGEEND